MPERRQTKSTFKLSGQRSLHGALSQSLNLGQGPEQSNVRRPGTISLYPATPPLFFEMTRQNLHIFWGRGRGGSAFAGRGGMGPPA